MKCVGEEFDQGRITKEAVKHYQESVKSNQPEEVQKAYHDAMVLEKTKSDILGLTTADVAKAAAPPSEDGDRKTENEFKTVSDT